MNVSLSNDLRSFVRKNVDSGDFPSEEAVLQEAVRRFQQMAALPAVLPPLCTLGYNSTFSRKRPFVPGSQSSHPRRSDLDRPRDLD